MDRDKENTFPAQSKKKHLFLFTTQAHGNTWKDLFPHIHTQNKNNPTNPHWPKRYWNMIWMKHTDTNQFQSTGNSLLTTLWNMICVYWSLVFQPRPLPLLSFCFFPQNSRVVNDDTLIKQSMPARSVFPLCWKRSLKFESEPRTLHRVRKPYLDNLMPHGFSWGMIIQTHLSRTSSDVCMCASVTVLQSSITNTKVMHRTSACKPSRTICAHNMRYIIKLSKNICCSINCNPLFRQ